MRSSDTPLYRAIRSNSLSEVTQIIETHPGWINDRNDLEDTPLHWACSWGHLEIARLLIEKGADLNAFDVSGHRPIHRAAVSGHLHLIEFLVEMGVDPDSLTARGQTSALEMLHPDRSSQHAAIFAWLMTHGAVFGLYQAVEYGMAHVVNLMLDAKPDTWLEEPQAAGAIVTACGLFFWSLNPSLQNKRRSIVRALLAHHANPNEIHSGTTPLLQSIQSNDAQLVEMLFHHGADVNLAVNGESPLLVAKRENNAVIIEMVLRRGARPDSTDVSV
jgi:ankyrin repeat protein